MGRHRFEPRIDGNSVGELAQVDRECPESQPRGNLGRHLPAIELGPRPFEEASRSFLVDLAQGVVNLPHSLGPVLDEGIPRLGVKLLGSFLDLPVRLIELAPILFVFLLERNDARRVVLLYLFEPFFEFLLDCLEPGRILDIGLLHRLLLPLLKLGDAAGHRLLGLANLVGPDARTP